MVEPSNDLPAQSIRRRWLTTLWGKEGITDRKSRKPPTVEDFKVVELWARCKERKHQRAHLAVVKRLSAVLVDAGLNDQAPQPYEENHQ